MTALTIVLAIFAFTGLVFWVWMFDWAVTALARAVRRSIEGFIKRRRTGGSGYW